MSEPAQTVAIGERDGKVILEFPKPAQWAAFDTETARQIGEAIAKQAYETRFGVKAAEGSFISEHVRNKLITRTVHVLRSLGGRHPEHIASEIVDTILAEVS